MSAISYVAFLLLLVGCERVSPKDQEIDLLRDGEVSSSDEFAKNKLGIDVFRNGPQKIYSLNQSVFRVQTMRVSSEWFESAGFESPFEFEGKDFFQLDERELREVISICQKRLVAHLGPESLKVNYVIHCVGIEHGGQRYAIAHFLMESRFKESPLFNWSYNYHFEESVFRVAVLLRKPRPSDSKGKE